MVVSLAVRAANATKLKYLAPRTASLTLLLNCQLRLSCWIVARLKVFRHHARYLDLFEISVDCAHSSMSYVLTTMPKQMFATRLRMLTMTFGAVCCGHLLCDLPSAKDSVKTEPIAHSRITNSDPRPSLGSLFMQPGFQCGSSWRVATDGYG